MSATNSLQAVRAPIEQARGLPNRFYTDEALFAEEKRRIFAAGWSGIGFAQDAANPGDVVPLEFLGTPLIAARGQDNKLRVFQNVCRHRGMTLVREKCENTRLIRCPYHSWSYDLAGALKATPHVGGPGKHDHPDIRKPDLGLFEVPAHEYLGVIFVNLSGDAPPFAEHAAELLARWEEFDLPLFSAGSASSLSLEVACNWKLAVENYCESYHLPFIHPDLNRYSKLEDHYHIEQPGKFSGQGSRVYAPQLGEDGRRLPDFPGTGNSWATQAEYISFFPNVLFGVQRDHAFALLLSPQAHDRTTERLEIFYAEDVQDEELLRNNLGLWRTVFSEDIMVVEGMQRGRACERFDGGKFSPIMDGPTHVFHEWVAERFA